MMEPRSVHFPPVMFIFLPGPCCWSHLTSSPLCQLGGDSILSLPSIVTGVEVDWTQSAQHLEDCSARHEEGR